MLHTIPEHRALVSVELPFCVTPVHREVEESFLCRDSSVASTTFSGKESHGESEHSKSEQRRQRVRRRSSSSEIFCSTADQRRVQSFLPSPEVFRCLTSDGKEWGTVRANETVQANSRNAQSLSNEEKLRKKTGLSLPSPDCSSSSSSFSAPVDSHSGVKEQSTPFTNEDKRKEESLRSFDIAHCQLYRTEPLWSTWRGTDWVSSEDTADEEEEEENVRQKAVPSNPSLSVSSLPRKKQKNAHAANASSSAKSEACQVEGVSVENNGKGEGTSFEEENMFPSSIPQLLLNGYYRNDLLLKVRHRTRVRRFRSRKTGLIIREEEIESDENSNESTPIGWHEGEVRHSLPDPSIGGNHSDGSSPIRRMLRFETSVLGVVSREVELARPADFAFSLYTNEEKNRASLCCNGDLFPPPHFLSAKAPFELKYEMGLQVNTAVLTAEQLEKHSRGRSQRLSGDGATDDDDDDVSPPLLSSGPESTHPSNTNDLSTSNVDAPDLFYIPLLTVNPDVEEGGIPPLPLPQQEEFLRRVGSSPTGLTPKDPEEVRVVARLLAARPIWAIKDLQEAALHSGVCPRGHFTKRIIHALTYVIPIGAYNRLRIRLGFNPYAAPMNVLYQRVAVRLHRRSAAGMLLRDISRSDKVEQVIHAIRHRKDNPIPLPWIVGSDLPARLQSSSENTLSPSHPTIPGSTAVVDSPTPSHFLTGKEDALDVSGVPRCSLREHFCRTILRGQLNINFQLIDSIESHTHQRLVEQTLRRWKEKLSKERKINQSDTLESSSREKENDGGNTVLTSVSRLPLSKRKEPSGWLTESEYSQALSAYSSSLVHFIEEEVIPLLKVMLQIEEEEPIENQKSASEDQSKPSKAEKRDPTTTSVLAFIPKEDHYPENYSSKVENRATESIFLRSHLNDTFKEKNIREDITTTTSTPATALLEREGKRKKIEETLSRAEGGEECSEEENAINLSRNSARERSSSRDGSSFGSSHASCNSSLASDMDDFSSSESIAESLRNA